jgi:tRNA pseudouridine55 synthase
MSAPRRPPRRQVDGVLLLDKPPGLTSNGALMRVKRLYNAEKAGHTGTLDPLASGLLPICFGVATRFAQFLLDAHKRYVATVRFGITTTTQDADGDVVGSRPVDIDRDALVALLPRFTGRLMQVPPAHSALKLAGKPYYDYARRGIDIPRAPREVWIHRLKLVAWNAPDATFDVECSKGTYVRALAADMGEALGCGAHLIALRRTASGGFSVENAMTLESIDAIDDEARTRLLLPTSALVAHLPRLDIDAATASAYLHGQAIPAATAAPCDGAEAAPVLAVFGPDGLLGVAEVHDGIARPRRSVSTAPACVPIMRAGCP